MKLYYREIGEGEPLVILHGLFGASDNWMSIAKELQNDFKLIIVDQRNHGQSEHAEEWNYEVMAEDLNELVTELNLSSFHLMGHSMGGKTAMKFASLYPQSIKKLIIVDIGPKYYAPHHTSILEGLNSLSLDTISSRSKADKYLSSYIPELGVRQFLLKNLSRESTSFKWKINLSTITQNIEEVGQELKTSDSIDISTLFVFGTKSDYVLPEDKADIRVLFPKSVFVGVNDAGHWIHAEKPVEFVATVKKFIKL